MLQSSKKISKLPRKPELRSQAKKPSEGQASPDQDSEQEINYEEKKKVPRYRFRQIPPHSKYVCEQPVYSMHGVPLTSFS